MKLIKRILQYFTNCPICGSKMTRLKDGWICLDCHYNIKD